MKKRVRGLAVKVPLLVLAAAVTYLPLPAPIHAAAGPEAAVTSRRGDEQAVECDSAASYLDHAVIDTLKLKGAYLIIIARLGRGERSRSLNQHRLRVVEEYIKRRGSELKYVLAEGDRVDGLGRVELYVGGQLLHAMPLVKNARGYCLPGREGY